MQVRRQDEPRKEQRAVEIAKAQKGEAAAAALELADVSLIFGFKAYLLEVMEGLGRAILFPVAAGASIIRAILKVREAFLEKKENKRGAIFHAGIEIFAASAITTAVIGSLAAEAAFSLAGPIIFIIALSIKTLFQLGSVFHYAYQAWRAPDSEKKLGYKEKAKLNLMLALFNSLTTIAAGFVFIAHKATFGLLGLIGGALGAAYAAYRAFTIDLANTAAAKEPATPTSAALTVTAKIISAVEPNRRVSEDEAVKRNSTSRSEFISISLSSIDGQAASQNPLKAQLPRWLSNSYEPPSPTVKTSPAPSPGKPK